MDFLGLLRFACKWHKYHTYYLKTRLPKNPVNTSWQKGTQHTTATYKGQVKARIVQMKTWYHTGDDFLQKIKAAIVLSQKFHLNLSSP